MSKIAFIYPGQGAQKCGMGKDFYENVPVCKEVYQKASEVTGLDIQALCFEENEQIHQTEYTQIAMLTTEVAILKALDRDYRKSACANAYQRLLEGFTWQKTVERLVEIVK